jgi:hypothetical protein
MRPRKIVDPNFVVVSHKAKSKDEGAPARAAYVAWLGLGPSRTLGTVAALVNRELVTVKNWHRDFAWDERLRAHEGVIAAAVLEAERTMVVGRTVDWAMRRDVLRETEWELHLKCVAAAQKAFATFLAKDNPFATLGDISKLLEMASKLGRLASGLPTDRTDISLESGPIQIEVTSAIEKIYGKAVPGPVIDVALAPAELQQPRSSVPTTSDDPLWDERGSSMGGVGGGADVNAD